MQEHRSNTPDTSGNDTIVELDDQPSTVEFDGSTVAYAEALARLEVLRREADKWDAALSDARMSFYASQPPPTEAELAADPSDFTPCPNWCDGSHLEHGFPEHEREVHDDDRDDFSTFLSAYRSESHITHVDKGVINGKPVLTADEAEARGLALIEASMLLRGLAGGAMIVTLDKQEVQTLVFRRDHELQDH